MLVITNWIIKCKQTAYAYWYICFKYIGLGFLNENKYWVRVALSFSCMCFNSSVSGTCLTLMSLQTRIDAEIPLQENWFSFDISNSNNILFGNVSCQKHLHVIAIVHRILCLYDLYFLVYLICIPYVTS